MTQFGQITDDTTGTIAFFESADPTDLQTQVNAYLNSLDEVAVTAITLAGGGDGHTFVVLVESAPFADAFGGLTAELGDVAVRCYLAGSADELHVAQTAVAPPIAIGGPTFAIVDEQMAGAAKGTRFMGMTVYSLPTAINANVPFGLFTIPGQVLSGPSVILGLTAAIVLAEGNQFAVFAPQVMQYQGKQDLNVKIELALPVEQTGAADDVTVDILQDPLGAATVLGTTKTHITTAGEFDTVSVLAIATLTAPIFSAGNIANSKLGIKVTSTAGDTTGFGGSMLITPL